MSDISVSDSSTPPTQAEPGSYEEDPNDPKPEQTDNSPRIEDGDQSEVSQDPAIDYSLDSK